MVYIQAEKKRGFLRQIVEGAKRNGLTLMSALLAAQQGQFTATFQGGRLLVSTSGAGQSGSFEISVQGKEWTPDNVFGLIEELIEILEFLFSQGLAIDSADGAEINSAFTAMRSDDRLVGVRTQMADVTSLNNPSIGGVPSQ